LIYPTGLTNYFHSAEIAASATVTPLVYGPLALKSFACGISGPDGPGGTSGGFTYKLYDGEVEVFRIFDTEENALVVYAATSNRFSFSLPLNGLRVKNSIGITIEATGTFTDLVASGISILYQR
tara:strand:- start:56 stop:427 length:372 start_codon:yes stop_codon:yes gene_type:complete